MAAHNIECLDLAGPSSKRERPGMERVLAMTMEASASAAVFGCNTCSYMRSQPAEECVVRLGFAAGQLG